MSGGVDEDMAGAIVREFSTPMEADLAEQAAWARFANFRSDFHGEVTAVEALCKCARSSRKKTPNAAARLAAFCPVYIASTLIIAVTASPRRG
jgi:hypothetical protein